MRCIGMITGMSQKIKKCAPMMLALGNKFFVSLHWTENCSCRRNRVFTHDGCS